MALPDLSDVVMSLNQIFDIYRSNFDLNLDAITWALGDRSDYKLVGSWTNDQNKILPSNDLSESQRFVFAAISILSIPVNPQHYQCWTTCQTIKPCFRKCSIIENPAKPRLGQYSITQQSIKSRLRKFRPLRNPSNYVLGNIQQLSNQLTPVSGSSATSSITCKILDMPHKILAKIIGNLPMDALIDLGATHPLLIRQARIFNWSNQPLTWSKKDYQIWTLLYQHDESATEEAKAVVHKRKFRLSLTCGKFKFINLAGTWKRSDWVHGGKRRFRSINVHGNGGSRIHMLKWFCSKCAVKLGQLHGDDATRWEEAEKARQIAALNDKNQNQNAREEASEKTFDV